MDDINAILAFFQMRRAAIVHRTKLISLDLFLNKWLEKREREKKIIVRTRFVYMHSYKLLWSLQ